MPRDYVALDLETTGLDTEHDAIIEIGAVRFDLDGRCDTFETFVQPGQPIPYRIQRLTGISETDVADAPRVEAVAGDVASFIGDAAIVGQNIAFDLRFLERALVRPPGPVYDTQELASCMLPDLIERNLMGIARHLNVDFPVRHRALADADATRQVFLELRRRLTALSPPLIAEAERIARAIDWPLSYLLAELLELAPPLNVDGDGLMHGAVRPPGKYGPALQPAGDEPEQIAPDEVERILTSTARALIDGFEERPEQAAMAQAVTASLNNSEELVVEAGTGVGKSLAYLVPAARFAIENDTRVVVSTNTINLQEQLIGQDIPAVKKLLGDNDGLRATQLKGRRNYLCLLRWSNLRRQANLSTDEAKLLVRLLLWLPHTDTGDRAELRLSQGEEAVWTRLSAQHEACLATPCAFVKDGSCFLLRARKRAEAAHLLVVNHALLLSDVVVGGGVIPEYEHLIVDEAQHLEDEATDQFGFHADEPDIVSFLDRVSIRGGGLVTSLRNATRGAPAARDLLELASRAEQAVERARTLEPEFFLRLSGFIRQQTGPGGDYDERLQLNRAMRVQPDWAEVEITWEQLRTALSDVLTALDMIGSALQTPGAADLLDRESLLIEASDPVQSGKLISQGIDGIVMHEDAGTVCWITERRSGGGVAVSSAPLRVADVLQERLFSLKKSTVLTSATLTAEGSFDYMRQTLGLSEANELLLGSPFDYARSTLVLVPPDIPEPSQNGYMAALQQGLVELVRASRGRALVLFTSHGSLQTAYRGIKPQLEEEGILVLAHHVDGSPRHLIQALRENPETVILGAASFWEGIDVVGEALSLLVIARLPFSVPDDPVFKARSELYDDAFAQYAVPQAVLRFKQGFGRLIRRKTDRGAMVILDSRVGHKTYGESFLRSLPSCTIERVPLRQAPGLVTRWLDAERP